MCRRTFGWTRKESKRLRQMVWFRRWLEEGYALRQLAQQSPHSTATLRRIIQYWLAQSPKTTPDLSQSRYLIFDGTYLIGRNGAIALMDARTHRILRGIYGMSEGPRHMHLFCTLLHEQGLRPKSVTVDGNPHVIHAFQAHWPGIIIQRCLVHIQRQGLMWCRQYPKRPDAKLLRKLFLLVTTVRSPSERDLFLSRIAAWEARYGLHIAVSRGKGWVFSDLKRARSMLIKALPDMFHYLDDPRIPATTNGLEGYFARLKLRYRQHRGISLEHRASYFQWYFHQCAL